VKKSNGYKSIILNKAQLSDIFKIYDAMKALNNWAAESGEAQACYEESIKDFIFDTLYSLQKKKQ
jgi:hypothetical protein